MSASDDDILSTSDLMDRAEGEDLGALTKTGLGAGILGIVALVINGMETVFDFLLVPFELFYDVAVAAVNATLIDPWNVVTGAGNVEVGAIEATAQALAGTFGFLSLPVANVVVLGSILVVVGFLAIGITSNFAPGVTVDNPIWDFFFGTAEEEGDDEG